MRREYPRRGIEFYLISSCFYWALLWFRRRFQDRRNHRALVFRSAGHLASLLHVETAFSFLKTQLIPLQCEVYWQKSARTVSISVLLSPCCSCCQQGAILNKRFDLGHRGKSWAIAEWDKWELLFSRIVITTWRWNKWISELCTVTVRKEPCAEQRMGRCLLHIIAV